MKNIVESLKLCVDNHTKKEESIERATFYTADGKNALYFYNGEEKEFFSLYEEIYKKYKIGDKKVSLKNFIKDTLFNVFFLREINLIDFVNKTYNKTYEYFTISPIHGICIESNEVIAFRNLFFIPKNSINNFIQNNSHNSLVDFHIKNLVSQNSGNFFYLAKKYNCYDIDFAKSEFEKDLDVFVNIFRFFIDNKNYHKHNYYVDFKTHGRSDTFIEVISKESGGNSESKSTNQFNEPYILDKSFFEKDDFKNVLLIMSKDYNSRNDFEKRIVESLIFCGKSIDEFYLDISLVELITAFEVLFKKDDKLITQSISDQIAETSAMILCDNYDDVIKLIKELKDLYKKRSSTVHGHSSGKISIEYYNNCLRIFRELIRELMSNDLYKDCVNITDLFILLDKRKYNKN